MDGFEEWKGKKVFVLLRNKRQYTGVVQDVYSNNGITFIMLIDKFNKRVGFIQNEVEVIQEEQ